MKKKMLTVLLVCTLLLGGCGNKQTIDTNYTFNAAYIDLGDKIVKVKVKKWNDYKDSDAVQVVAKDGTVYYTHLSKCVLVKEAK